MGGKYMFLAFLKNNSLKLIRHKLLFIYILNVSDIVFTQLLLGTGYFIEANIFMRSLVENQWESILVKTIFVLLLLTFIWFRIGSATERQLITSNKVINVCLIFYFIINFSHITWSIAAVLLF
jgi:hypothetical protein